MEECSFVNLKWLILNRGQRPSFLESILMGPRSCRCCVNTDKYEEVEYLSYFLFAVAERKAEGRESKQ